MRSSPGGGSGGGVGFSERRERGGLSVYGSRVSPYSIHLFIFFLLCLLVLSLSLFHLPCSVVSRLASYFLLFYTFFFPPLNLNCRFSFASPHFQAKAIRRMNKEWMKKRKRRGRHTRRRQKIEGRVEEKREERRGGVSGPWLGSCPDRYSPTCLSLRGE